MGQRRLEYPVNIHMEVSGKQLIVESKAQERKSDLVVISIELIK